MAELLQAIYDVRLEERIYDFWALSYCQCDKEDPSWFFAKYPFVNYVVQYNEKFRKPMTGFIGTELEAYPVRSSFQKCSLFEKVFTRGHVTLYKVRIPNSI